MHNILLKKIFTVTPRPVSSRTPGCPISSHGYRYRYEKNYGAVEKRTRRLKIHDMKPPLFITLFPPIVFKTIEIQCRPSE